MRWYLGPAAALLLAVRAQSSSGQTSEPPALRGAVNAPPASVFNDAVRGRAVDPAAAASAARGAPPQRRARPVNQTAVPEPSSVAMLASGATALVGALWLRRRRS